MKKMQGMENWEAKAGAQGVAKSRIIQSGFLFLDEVSWRKLANGCWRPSSANFKYWTFSGGTSEVASALSGRSGTFGRVKGTRWMREERSGGSFGSLEMFLGVEM